MSAADDCRVLIELLEELSDALEDADPEEMEAIRIANMRIIRLTDILETVID